MNKKVIVILGPTSTGKSDLAVNLAKKINGEIISADSRQVYKGLNIGTGKITKKEMKGIPHYLLDVATPKKRFTVAEYKILAEKLISDILKRKKIPIVCGGTGFYIDAITKGLVFPEVLPNVNLRKDLEKKNVQDLYNILYKLDKRRALTIDKNNKVRLIRAIEIAKELGNVPRLRYRKSKFNFIKIGLYLSNELLKEKISLRLNKRLKIGMLKEVKKLHSLGLSWKRMEELGLEYRYIALYLQKKITKDQMIKKLNTEINKYAKRQMTWFKRDKKVFWCNASSNIDINEIISLMKKD